MSNRERAQITGDELITVDELAPLAGVAGLGGIRIFDVGQGDSLAVLDFLDRPLLHIDYGGRQGNPFQGVAASKVDEYLPVRANSMIMVTHWDEDHWCSAPKGSSAAQAQWLVPRQITSPRAVRFSAQLDRISCIPESMVGRAFCFRALNGDELWWEKIGASSADAGKHEDCNKTGVAMSLVRRDPKGGGEVILMPGDASFGQVSHYHNHFRQGLSLNGFVAFHHGAGTHWDAGTLALMKGWKPTHGGLEIIFSCADPNTYEHPDLECYGEFKDRVHYMFRTSELRHMLPNHVDLGFRWLRA
jgi:hypothetical protein